MGLEEPGKEVLRKKGGDKRVPNWHSPLLRKESPREECLVLSISLGLSTRLFITKERREPMWGER